MNRLIPCAAAIVLASVAAAGCTKSGTNSAYNNSGTSATPSQPSSTATSSDSSAPSSAAPTTDVASSSTTASQTPASGNVVADTVTTGKVKAAIASDSGLKDADIVVKTDAGVVVLSGTVKSRDQIVIATNLAKGQEGVNRVETQIVLR